LIGQLRNNNSNLDSSLLLQKRKTVLQENILVKSKQKLSECRRETKERLNLMRALETKIAVFNSTILSQQLLIEEQTKTTHNLNTSILYLHEQIVKRDQLVRKKENYGTEVQIECDKKQNVIFILEKDVVLLNITISHLKKTIKERDQVISKKEKNNGKLLQVIAQQDKRIIALEKDKAVLDNENFHLRKQIEKQDESFLRSNRLISKNQEHLWEMVLTFAKQGDVENRLGKPLRDVKSEFVETKCNKIKQTKKKKKKKKTCENKDTGERTKYYSSTSAAA